MADGDGRAGAGRVHAVLVLRLGYQSAPQTPPRELGCCLEEAPMRKSPAQWPAAGTGGTGQNDTTHPTRQQALAAQPPRPRAGDDGR